MQRHKEYPCTDVGEPKAPLSPVPCCLCSYLQRSAAIREQRRLTSGELRPLYGTGAMAGAAERATDSRPASRAHRLAQPSRPSVRPLARPPGRPAVDFESDLEGPTTPDLTIHPTYICLAVHKYPASSPLRHPSNNGSLSGAVPGCVQEELDLVRRAHRAARKDSRRGTKQESYADLSFLSLLQSSPYPLFFPPLSFAMHVIDCGHS